MGKVTVQDSRRSLYKDITVGGGRLKEAKKSKVVEEEEEDEAFIDDRTSRKILQLAREQQEEEGEGEMLEEVEMLEEQLEEDEEEYEDFYPLEYEDEVDPVQASAFGQLNQLYNLADKIMAKINEREQEQVKPQGVLLPPKVIAAYEAVGQILSTWTHGKLPKLFKVLPSLNNWEDVVFVTNPDTWTPHVVYEATKLFVSNLQSKDAERFVRNVLLERFRLAIETSEDHLLNYHIYRALKKAMYKPGAYFRGFLFPLVEERCTVREATIAASVLSKVSVPALHSLVALLYLCQQEFSPAATVFIRVLLEKRYALPYQTVDDCVFYFMRFRDAAQGSSGKDMPPLPVVWHKAFLAFATRYKNDITEDQRDFLMETVRQRWHKDIGPEIRRELVEGRDRMDQA